MSKLLICIHTRQEVIARSSSDGNCKVYCVGRQYIVRESVTWKYPFLLLFPELCVIHFIPGRFIGIRVRQLFCLTPLALAVSLLMAACSGASAPVRVAGHGTWIAQISGTVQTYHAPRFPNSRLVITPLMAYDPATSQLVMLAGSQSSSSPCSQTALQCHFNTYKDALFLLSGEWIWNGVRWKAQRVDTLASYQSHLVPPETGLIVPTSTSNSLFFDGQDNALVDLGSSPCMPPIINTTSNLWTCHLCPKLPFPFWIEKNGFWTRIIPTPAQQEIFPFVTVSGGYSTTYDPATHTCIIPTPLQEEILRLVTASGGYSIAYDPATHQVVLFGGLGKGSLCSICKGFFGDTTWLLNENNWTEANPRSHPAPRVGAAMVYDPNTHQLLLYGGWGLSPNQMLVTPGVHGKSPQIIAYHDTWVWTGSNWKRLHPKNHPIETSLPLGGNGGVELSGSQQPSVLSAYDSSIGAPVVLVSDGTTDQNYLWKWTGNNWLPIATTWTPRLTLKGYMHTPNPTPPNPEGGYIAAMSYDSATNQLIAVGSTSWSGSYASLSAIHQSFDTWIFRLSELSPSSSLTPHTTTTASS